MISIGLFIFTIYKYVTFFICGFSNEYYNVTVIFIKKRRKYFIATSKMNDPVYTFKTDFITITKMPTNKDHL